MLNEPPTIASVARLIGDTLEADYGVDPAPLFAWERIDTTKFYRPGSRIIFSKMTELWGQAVDALSLIHISEPTRPVGISRMPSSA